MSQAAPAPFLFVAVKPAGGRTLGVRRARSRPALAEVLRREKLLLLQSWRLPSWLDREGRISLKDYAVLNEVLAQLLSRGVPLVEALDVTASAVSSGVRPRVERLRELVSGGSSYADACKAAGGFDDVSVSVYRAAERTGDLAGAARQLAATAKRQIAVAGKAGTLMLYPSIVLVISMVVASILLTTIVPKLGEQLADANIPLPRYSQIVMSFGRTLRDNGTFLLVVLAAAAVALLIFNRKVGDAIGRFSRAAPMLRDVVLAQEAARFFSVMAAMTRSGVPLSDALAVGNKAVKLRTLRQQLERLRTRLIEGGILKNLIEEVDALPLTTRRLLIAAERSGDLEAAFSALASDMTEEVERRSSRLLAVLEPAMIVFIFLVIGSLLLSILVPMITMTSGVGTN
ncbi:MAG: type II secretion system F family protein [Phycisphaerae bacterium]|nr:type II secretion system F family protein [Phycisphaerae bacterium]